MGRIRTVGAWGFAGKSKLYWIFSDESWGRGPLIRRLAYRNRSLTPLLFMLKGNGKGAELFWGFLRATVPQEQARRRGAGKFLETSSLRVILNVPAGGIAVGENSAGRGKEWEKKAGG